MESSNLRRAIVYGVAGLATAAIGASTVNSLVSDAGQPEAQKAGQPSPVPGTAPAAPPPPAPVPATKLQVQPAPAAPPVVKPTKKPTAAKKPTAKVKQVPVRKTKQDKKKTIVVKRPAVVPLAAKAIPHKKPVPADPSLTRALANVSEARAAVRQAETGLAEARKRLRHAESEVDRLRKRPAGKHRVVKTVTGMKVSKDLTKRLHRSAHVKTKPGKTLKVSVSSKG